MHSSAIQSTSPAQLIEAMAQVRKPLGTATGLPNPSYTDQEFYHFEREHVLGASWASAAFTSELPEPGYAKPIDLMGEPLLLVRDKSDQINVFHNVCSHRGMPLLDEEKKIRNLITCPYHGWGYSCAGQLSKTPNIGGVNIHTIDGFDNQAHGLKPVRHAVWMNIIFVNLSGAAESFEDFIAPLEKRWQPFLGSQESASINPSSVGSNVQMDLKCNWKLPIENYCEAYHLPIVHPVLNRQSPLDQHYNITDGHSISGQGSNLYKAATIDAQKLPIIDGWPSDQLQQAEYISLYPNTLLGIQADHFFALIVVPTAVDASHEKLEISYIGEQAQQAEFDDLRTAVLNNWQEVFAEDIFAVEGMQRGRRSSAFDGGVLTPLQDIPTHHFHSWVADKYITALS